MTFLNDKTIIAQDVTFVTTMSTYNTITTVYNKWFLHKAIKVFF